MLTIADIGEFALIERICAGTPPSDDCACLSCRDGFDTLVSTDMLVEGTHFLRESTDPFDLGWKSAAVNISDIAASGGRPVGLLLSLSLPSDLSVEWVERFAEGFLSAGVPLVGGDTTGSKGPICISVTVLGECPKGKAKTRTGAREGDLICVTGPLGDSAGGLKAILEGRQSECPEKLLRAHRHPVPLVEEGVALAQTEGVSAMMDVSDGLVSDIPHLLGALGADVDVQAVPVSGELVEFAGEKEARRLSLCGGEDYALLFTMAPGCRPPVECHTIGEIVSSHTGVRWKGDTAGAQAFDHFGGK